MVSGDLLGFNLPAGMSVQQQQHRRETLEQTEKYAKLWDSYVKKAKLPSRSKLKELIRKGGIPFQHRTWVWSEISGARAVRQTKSSTYFQNLVVAGLQKSKSLHQIELDLPRTYPEHSWLHGDEGQEALKSVLVAYSMHNSKAGYCQGLNFVASTILLATDRNPETGFYLLVALLENILYKDTHAPYLPGFQIEMKVLKKLVQKKLPDLAQHLDQMGCEMTILATDWFLCIFVTSLPHEVSARVMDCLFCEGSKILFRVSLALLQLHQQLLMSHDNAGELLQPLKESVNGWWSADVLLRTAFENIGGLPMKKIAGYRDKNKDEVLEMVKEREALRRRQEYQERQRQAEEDKKNEDAQDVPPDLAQVARDAVKVVGQGAQVVGSGITQLTQRTRAALKA